LHNVVPGIDVDLCPVADGGEGTVDAMLQATDGTEQTDNVTGPLGEPVEARWGMLGDGYTAAIEMAAAAGLMLVPPEQRDPTRTTTFGVGQLIARAMDHNARRIIVGIGGSATTDGGLGMALALGLSAEGIQLPGCGADMAQVQTLDRTAMDSRLANTRIEVACDVDNPLVGPEGAAAVYGPQKGATPQQVEQLDAGLQHLADVLGIDPAQPGFGAAGGLGFGLVAFCGATLRSGVELVLDAVDFDRRVRDADLVITGEGRLDGQSIRGKTCIGVARAAAKHDVPTLALVGSLGPQVELTLDHGLAGYHALTDICDDIERCKRDAAPLLEQLAAQVIGDLG